jgi:hypothetical protein
MQKEGVIMKESVVNNDRRDRRMVRQLGEYITHTRECITRGCDFKMKSRY